jgi:hypothetical protein
MFRFQLIFLSMLLFAALEAWPQAAPSATGYAPSTTDDDSMQTPPPVSGEAYPIAVGLESPANYLRGGVVANAAYSDNLLAGVGSTPISGMSYSISPLIAIDKTIPRSHAMLTYSPGFTFYQHESAWNQQSQNLSFDSQYRLSPHIAMSAQEGFLKSSNILNQSNPLAGIAVSGSVRQSPVVPLVLPFANQTSNAVSTGLTYQFSSNDMIGGSGTFALLHYSDQNEAQELYNSGSRGGTAFYNHRLSPVQYFGAIYQFSENLDTPVRATNQAQGDTHIHSALLFYTLYLKSTLSFSLLAGPQHYDVSALPAPPSAAWTPTVTASVGWQGLRTGLAAGYSRQINAGGGLLGAFHGNSASISGQWRITRAWSAGLAASYTNTTNVSSAVSLRYPGGTSASGAVAVHHEINEHLHAEIGYARLYQDYGNIAATSTTPNTDRVYVSVSYQFLRALGR